MASAREDFIRALRGEPVWPVPYSIKLTVEAKERRLRETGEPFDPVSDGGSYVVASHTNDGWEEVSPGYFRDPFGVVWNKTLDRTLGVVDDPPIRGYSLDGVDFPDPASDLPVYRAIALNACRYPDRFHMLSIGFLLFERAWSLMGMAELMIAMLEAPEFVDELFGRITDVNVGLIRRAAVVGGVDCVHFGDDWGSQAGPLIAPDLWRKLVKPHFRRTCRAARECGLRVSLHCCGDVRALIPDMIDCGVDVFDPFQPEVMDVREVYRTYRGRMAFWGGLSVQRTLPRGAPAEVRAETLALLRDLGSGGGYILAPSHSIPGDVPTANVDAFLEVARNQPRFA